MISKIAKMKKQLALLTFFIFLFHYTNAQTFKWAAQFGGTDYDTGEEMAVDSAGNVYTVGIFNSTADFDPGASTYNLTSAGAQDVYVVKVESNKNFVWAVRVGGKQQDFSYSIALNGSAVFICGNFRDTVDFNPGAPTYNLISAGGSDIFILKLDTASNFIWAKQIGGSGNDVAEKISIDNAGNLLLCGTFQDTADFNPNAGVHDMISIGSADAYVLKLQPSGNFVWAGQFGNSSGQFANSITTDAANDVYVTGEYYGTIDFDPGAAVYNLTATGFNANVFVFKWSSAGNFIWADDMGNSSGGDEGYAIKTDASGNPVITGSYFGTVDFDPGPNMYNLTATGNNGDIFILKLTSSTGTFVFAKTVGGSGLDQAYGLALNLAGDIYVTGFYSLTADFDPGTSTFNMIASGPADAFILELDASGNFLWAYGFGGTDNDFARGITTNGSDVYISGVFAYTADFNPGIQTYNISSFSNTPDAFLVKLRFCTPVQNMVSYSLCPGDSIFAGGIYQTIPGVYFDYFTAAGGCDSIVTSIVQYTFTLNLGNDISSCEHDSVLINSNVGGADYLWSTGETTAAIFVTTADAYWVSVTYNGCTLEDTISVSFNPLPAVALGNDTIICENASITYNAGSGFNSYIWSDGSTNDSFVLNGSSGAGTYTVSVIITDSAGCSNSDTVEVIVSTCAGIDFYSRGDFNCYPLPANDYLFVQSPEKINQITLFDAIGKVVLMQKYNGSETSLRINLSSVGDGIYYLQLNEGDLKYKKKLVVIH
jgi:hypothetical protein